MAQKAWILRYGELGLKSRVVRRQFQRALSNNLDRISKNAKVPLIKDRIKTMEVVTSDSSNEVTENLLCHLLGVVIIDRSEIIADCIDPVTVSKEILERDTLRGKPRTFGVRTRRVGARGEYTSQEYSGEIGAAMCELDETLSVDLTNPDIWVRLVLEIDCVWHMSKRIEGAGGLPPGVQGDVLCKITDEDTLLSSFLIMRRGSRLIPVEGSDEKLLDILRRWDPFIGRTTREWTRERIQRDRYPWGVVGLSIDEGEKLIVRAEGRKTTPLSTLEPLCGWTDEEKISLKKHILEPSLYPCVPDIEAWVS